MFIVYTDPEEPVDMTGKLSNELFFSNVYATEEFYDLFKVQDDQKTLQILLEGDPGSGKTTIVKEIAYRWANGKMLKSIELLLIVNYQSSSLCKRSIKNFNEFINYFYKKAPKQCESYFENLEGEGLMIILDNYHDLPTIAHHKFFVELMQRKILPKCMIVMTTQSAILLNHIKHVHVKQIRVAKVLGLTSQVRDEYLSSAEACVNHLCYNPLNLKMYLWCLCKDPSIIPLTQTDLIDKYIILNVTHVSGHRDITCEHEEFITRVKMSLAQLAYEKLIKGKLVFSKKTFKRYKLKKEYVTEALVKHDSLNDNKYTFAYATIQYYLAATYILQNKVGDRESYHQSWFRNKLHFLKFYAIISSSQNLLLQHSFTAESTVHVATFLGMFKEFCKSKIDRLLLCYILSDVNNDHKAKIPVNNVVDEFNCSIDLSCEDLSLTGVDSLVYFIGNCNMIISWNCIDLSNCKLGDKGCETLCQLMPLVHVYKNITIKSLKISGNNLSCSSLFPLCNLVKVLNIKELTASNNMFTNSNFSIFADIQLECLDLSSNQFHFSDVVLLCQALRHCQSLKQIALNNTHISDNAVTVLVTSVEKWNHFESFKSNNAFINELLLFIKRNLLYAIDETITFDGDADSVKNFIIFLRYAKDVHDTASDLINNIAKILNLSLQCIHYISEKTPIVLTVGASEFFIKFENLQTLDLSGIIVDEQASGHLARAFGKNMLQSLENLIMNKCCLTSAVVTELVQALQMSSKLKEFHACNNFICDNATESLAIAILHWKALKTLNIFKNNRFTESSKLLLIFLLKSMHNSISDHSLCLSGTAVKAFIAIMRNMMSLQTESFEKLENLKLKYMHNNIELEEDACELFCRFIYLKELHFTNIIIVSKAVPIIADVVAYKLCSLQTLALCNCGLHSKNVTVIMCTQRKATTIAFQNLRKLDLSCNYITDEAVLSLLTSFLQMPKLTEICMDNNQLVCHDINKIAKLINDFRTFRSSIKYVSNLDSKHELLSTFLTLLRCMNSIEATKSCQVKNLTMINELSIQSLHNMKVLSLTKNEALGLVRVSELVKLNITGICIKPSAVDILAKCLAIHFVNLKELMLSDCQLDSDSVTKLLNYDKKIIPAVFKTLNKLNFDNNNITQKATEPIITSILKMSNLNSLSVDNNPIKSQIIKKAFDIVIQMRTFNPYYSSNDKSVEYVTALVTLLNSAPNISPDISLPAQNIMKLKVVNIACCTDIKLAPKSLLFFKKLIDLEELKINGLCFEQAVIGIIIDALTSNLSMLKMLNLSDCQLTSSYAIALLSPCKSAALSQLTELDLSHNKIEDDAIYSVIESLLQIPKLAKVNFEGNPLSDSNLLAISRITTDFKSSMSIIEYSVEEDKDKYISSLLTILSSMKNVFDERSYQVQNILTVSKIDLQCLECEPPIVMTEDVPVFFCRLNNLETLNLSGICIKAGVLNAISNALFNKLGNSLKQLTLIHCQINSESLPTLFEKQNFPELINLNLSNNDITDTAVDLLVSAFFHMPKLSVLNIDNNPFKHYNMKAIFYVILNLRQAKISSIDNINRSDYTNAVLSLFDIVNRNISSLENSSEIKNLTHIQYLNLNCIEQKVDIQITENAVLFMQRFTFLEEINMSGIHILPKAANPFGCLIATCSKSLISLMLSKCQLDSKSAITILTTDNVTFESLKVLDFSNNSIDDGVIYPLLTSLLQMKRLKNLNFKGNKFSEINEKALQSIAYDFCHFNPSIDYSTRHSSKKFIAAFLALLRSMKDISTTSSYQVDNIVGIKELNLKSIHSGRLLELTEDASCFFYKFTSLIKLNLSGISIKPRAAKAVANALVKHIHSLKALQLSGCQLNSNSALTLLSCYDQTSPPVVFHELTELDLSKNIIKSSAISALVSSLLQMPKLIEVNFGDNKLTSSDIKAVESVISDFNHPITSIDYSSMHNSEQSVNAFLILLEAMRMITAESSHQVRTIVNIEKLHLNCFTRNCSNPPVLTMNASNSFQKFNCLMLLSLSGIYVQPESIRIINNALASNLRSLKVLTLSKCQLDSNSVIELLSFRKCVILPNLRELDLSYNKIEDDAIYSVIESLLQIPKLTKVNFENNLLSKSNLLAINCITSDFSSCMTVIDYSDKADKDTYISSLFTILSSMKNVSEKRSCQVKNILTVNKIILQCLDHKISITMTEGVLSFFCRFINLKELNLDGICISNCTAFATVLKNYELLDTLIINRCGLDSKFVSTMLSSLSKIKLRELCLSENEYIDCQAVDAISIFIYNSVLKALNLSSNALTDNEAIVLADGLVGCKNLQYLNLSNNKITDQTMSKLLTSFLQMVNLATLHIENNPGEKMIKIAFDIIIKMRKPLYNFVSTSNDEVNAFLMLLSSAANILPSASVPVHTLIRIKKLHIQCSNCAKCTAKSLSLFKTFVGLEELRFIGLCIESEAISVIANSLSESLCSLRVLDLSNCQLDSYKAITLLTPCKSVTLPHLTELDLSCNKINTDAIYSVIECLLQIPKLSKVNFNENFLNKSNMLAIRFITSKFSITTSTVDYGKPESDAFHTLLSSAVSIDKGRSYQVTMIEKINTLILQFTMGCKMSKEFSLFFKKFEALHTLKINNICIESVAVCNLSKALKGNLGSIEELILNYCNLRAVGIEVLAIGLKNCKNLHTLDLAYNNIADTAAETLRNMAKSLYPKLTKLNIDDNDLSTTSKKNIYYEVYSASCIIS